VPGLGAKPIVGMMAGVKGPHDANQCIPSLRKIGYISFTADLGDPERKRDQFYMRIGPFSFAI